MKGTSHAAIGCSLGIGVGLIAGLDITTTTLLATAGGISALFPDLDTSGKLTNNITISDKSAKVTTFFLGILVLVYSTYLSESINYKGIIGGVCLLLISFFLNKSFMLTVTGILLLALGISLSKLWIICLSAYIVVASFLPHRSYTHSLIGLLYFSYIAYLFSQEVEITGLFITCVLGYLSHLLADTRIIPTNRRGVRLLKPFTNFEF